MSEFRLSDGIDEDKIFFINLSDLENRYDPLYYKLAKKYTFESVKLNTFLLDVFQGQVQGYINEDNIKVLKVKNLDLFGNIDFTNVTYINDINLKKVLRYGDIITPFRGQTIFTNKFAFFDSNEKVTIDNNLGIIRLDTKKIIPKFFRYYISSKIGFNEILKNVGGAGIPALTKEIIKNIDVPVLSTSIQQNIIVIMDKAYLSKKQKEKQANELLENIDTYLLDELGITLPEVDNSLDKRIFEVKLSDVSGGRFDAPSNSQRFEFISKYDLENFDEIIFIDPSIGKIEDETLCTFLPMEKISDTYGEANISENKFYRDSKGYTKFKDNDLLWSKITPCMQNGKSAVVSNLKNNIGFGSTEYYVFRTISEKINIKYIHSFLRLDILKKEAMKFFSGSVGHQRVSKSFFKSLKIPLPPIEKQNEIAKHIQSIRDKAKQLKLEAVQELESAKAEVEKMILGL